MLCPYAVETSRILRPITAPILIHTLLKLLCCAQTVNIVVVALLIFVGELRTPCETLWVPV